MTLKHLIATAALMLAGAAASSAQAHAKLQLSVPPAGSVVAQAPKELRLQFNEKLELPFSKVKLLDQNNAVLTPSALAIDKADPHVLVATLPVLKAGAYRVQWTTVTRDGHKVKGEFSFSVK